MQQATFDEAVQQNIDTFSMSPEEAVKAVVAEFKVQGVDLSNIIKTPRGGDLQDHKIVEETKELLAAIDSRYFIKAREGIRRLKQLVSQERQVEVSAVVVTCFTVPALIARAEELPDVTPLYLDMLAHCLAPDESRPAFALGEEGATMLRNVLLGFPAPAGKVAQTAAQVARAAATRNEANKMHMMYQGVADVLCGHIETQPANIAAECCSALEAMFTMDDPRPIPLQIFNYVMNDAVDRAIPALLAQLKVNGRADAELAKAALSALRPVAANYQICKKLMDANGVEKVVAMFNELKLLSQLSVKRAAVVLLRQLAAGNADKQQIAESGGLELAETLVLELSEVKLGKEVKLVEEAMGFLSEMLLNQRVAEQSGHCCANVMLNALRDAPDITPPVAKQTIKSVSALVSHNPNLRAVLRENDSVLEDIRERFADFYDVASAIGDLRRDN